MGPARIWRTAAPQLGRLCRARPEEAASQSRIVSEVSWQLASSDAPGATPAGLDMSVGCRAPDEPVLLRVTLVPSSAYKTVNEEPVLKSRKTACTVTVALQEARKDHSFLGKPDFCLGQRQRIKWTGAKGVALRGNAVSTVDHAFVVSVTCLDQHSGTGCAAF